MVPLIIGFAVNGWNVYRSLRPAGVTPVALDDDPSSVFWATRGVQLQLCERLSGDALLQAIRRVAADGRSYVVVSATEEAVRTLNEGRDQLPANVRLLFPEQHIVELLLDKQKFYEHAKAEGHAISRMHFPERWTDIPAPSDIQFPCILKARTKIYAAGLAKAYRLTDYAGLVETIREISALPGLKASDFVIQEWVPGTDSDVLFCMQYYDQSGNPRISFVGRKIRQWRPEIGGTASAEAIKNTEVLQETTRFFRSVRMRGICSMEFKQSSQDGKLYMIEPTACRADYQEGVAIANGYNIPLAAYADATGSAQEIIQPARRPVKWLHLGDDYASASHYVGRGELTWRKWMQSLRGPKSYAIFSAEDPGPFVELIRRKFANRIRRIYSWT